MNLTCGPHPPAHLCALGAEKAFPISDFRLFRFPISVPIVTIPFWSRRRPRRSSSRRSLEAAAARRLRGATWPPKGCVGAALRCTCMRVTGWHVVWAHTYIPSGGSAVGARSVRGNRDMCTRETGGGFRARMPGLGLRGCVGGEIRSGCGRAPELESTLDDVCGGGPRRLGSAWALSSQRLPRAGHSSCIARIQ